MGWEWAWNILGMGLEYITLKRKKTFHVEQGGGGWGSGLGRISLYINPPYKKFPPYGERLTWRVNPVYINVPIMDMWLCKKCK